MTPSHGAMGVFVSSAEQDRRMAICRACPEMFTDRITKASRCQKCRCFLKAKTWIPGQHCPLKKW